jgi:uncharacterized protein YlaI
MIVRCSICGQQYNIKKTHKDYQRLASNPKGSFFCFNCNTKTEFQAKTNLGYLKKSL